MYDIVFLFPQGYRSEGSRKDVARTGYTAPVRERSFNRYGKPLSYIISLTMALSLFIWNAVFLAFRPFLILAFGSAQVVACRRLKKRLSASLARKMCVKPVTLGLFSDYVAIKIKLASLLRLGCVTSPLSSKHCNVIPSAPDWSLLW